MLGNSAFGDFMHFGLVKDIKLILTYKKQGKIRTRRLSKNEYRDPSTATIVTRMARPKYERFGLDEQHVFDMVGDKVKNWAKMV